MDTLGNNTTATTPTTPVSTTTPTTTTTTTTTTSTTIPFPPPYNRKSLSWNSTHSQNKERTYCYCAKDRSLSRFNLQCSSCLNWYHDSCIQTDLSSQQYPIIPFISNYEFVCAWCMNPSKKGSSSNKPEQQIQQSQQIQPLERFARTTASWKEVLATAMANLCLKRMQKEGLITIDPTTGQETFTTPVIPDHYYFNKKDHICPFLDKHWNALCTDRARTATWWATVGSVLYTSSDVFGIQGDEASRSAVSSYMLFDRDLFKVRPGHTLVPGTTKSVPKKRAEGDSTTSTSTSKKQRTTDGLPSHANNKRMARLGSSTSSSAPPQSTAPSSSKVRRDPSEQSLQLAAQDNLLTGDHPFNKHGWKYTWTEEDTILRTIGYRENLLLPSQRIGVFLSTTDRSHLIKLSEDALSTTTDKGFCSIRATCGVKSGNWFFEVKVDRGGGEGKSEDKDGAHVRIGWGRREAALQAPVGYDSYGYAYRDANGNKVHESFPRPYGESYKTGDVIGVYISIPTVAECEVLERSWNTMKQTEAVNAANTQSALTKAGNSGNKPGRKRGNSTKESQPKLNLESDTLPEPKSMVFYKRDRILIKVKGNLFFEGREYAAVNSQPDITSEALSLLAFTKRSLPSSKKTPTELETENDNDPSLHPEYQLYQNLNQIDNRHFDGAPISSAIDLLSQGNLVNLGPTRTSQPNTTTSGSSTNRHRTKSKTDLPVSKEPTSTIFPRMPGSKIMFFKNGGCQGIAYEDLPVPIAASCLMETMKRLSKEQTHKDNMQKEEAQVYGNIPVLPIKDDGSLGYYPMVSVFKGGACTVNFGPEFVYPPAKELGLEWKPLCERYEDREVENLVWDAVDEVEGWFREAGYV